MPGKFGPFQTGDGDPLSRPYPAWVCIPTDQNLYVLEFKPLASMGILVFIKRFLQAENRRGQLILGGPLLRRHNRKLARL